MLWHIPIDWRWALKRNMGCKKWCVLIDKLACFLQAEEDYHPQGEKIFAAFKATAFNKVRVVIIGQDPYPKKCEATGLAFSMPKHKKKLSPSIQGINRALKKNLKKEPPKHGNLDHWTAQGVFLLNRVLTLRKVGNKKNTHKRNEWRDFTQAVVLTLAKSNRPIHFILWGVEAQEIRLPFNYPECLIHRAYHPMSSKNGADNFKNCRHFSEVNAVLRAMGEKRINWLP